MNFCVNVNAPEFKETAKRLNISEGQLDNILHEYMNQRGTDKYPSDAYIMAKTQGVVDFNASDSVVELWERSYSQPQVFNSKAEFVQAKTEALNYFKPSSIGVRETADGKYVMTVAEQVNGEILQREYDEIKQKAIADGTFMKAPNGEPTNLTTEQQWLQVRSKRFKKWFGDWENDPEHSSQVLDGNGEPLVVYHGGAKGITEFRVGSPETSTTGYGTYTEERTGRKIPVDSARAIFFSSNPFVGQSYAQLYALSYFEDLARKTGNIIKNVHDDKASLNKKDFKSFDEFYDFLTIVSEYNPRFAKLRDYIKELKKKGERLKPNEIAAARQLFIDLRSTLEEYTEDCNLYSSEWDNILTVGRNIIKEYLGGRFEGENIDRLVHGEIPEYMKKEWELFTKIRNHREKYGLPYIANYDEVFIYLSGNISYTDSDYVLKYNGKELIFDETNGKRNVPISQMSADEIQQFLQLALQANTHSFLERDNNKVKQAYREKSGYYPAFLNIRNPLEHDYEGTHMGQGYKQNPKVSFGYVAARQVDKAIRDGSDGVIYRNLYDPYLADNYGVFEPNQIKSATENIGTFEEFDDNIYNQEASELDIANDRKFQKLTEIQADIDTIQSEIEKINRNGFINDAIRRYNSQFASAQRDINSGGIVTSSGFADFVERFNSKYSTLISAGIIRKLEQSDSQKIVKFDSDGRAKYDISKLKIKRSVPALKKSASEQLRTHLRELNERLTKAKSDYMSVEMASLNEFGNFQEGRENNMVSNLKDEMSASEVYEKLSKQYSEDSSEGKLSKLVFDVLQQTGITFKATDSLPDYVRGRFSASDNVIYFNKAGILSNTLLHEAIHAVSIYYMKATNKEGFSKEVQIACKEIEECYELLKQDMLDRKASIDSIYGMKSATELVAEITRPEVLSLIKDFDVRHKGQNIFQRLISAIAKFFGINKKYGSLEKTLKDALVTLIENPNAQLMRRYALENRTAKENWQTLRTKGVEWSKSDKYRAIIEEAAERAPEDGRVEIAVSKQDILDGVAFMVPEKVSGGIISESPIGTLFVSIQKRGAFDVGEEIPIFFTIDGPARVDGDNVTLPIRLISREWMSTNTFNVQTAKNGMPFITDIMPLFGSAESRGEVNILAESNDPDSPSNKRIRPANQAFFGRQITLGRKIDALYNNDVGLTSIEIQQESDALVNWISDNLTEWQKDPEKIFDNFEALRNKKTNNWETDEDKKADIDKLSNMSRRELLNFIELGNILQAYKEKVFDTNPALEDADFETIYKTELIKDSLDALLEIGKAKLFANEHFTLSHNDTLNTVEAAEQTSSDEISVDGETVDTVDLSEYVRDLQDWMIDHETQEVLSNATALVRDALNRCYEVEKDGSRKLDDIGRAIRIDSNTATKAIVNWVQGALTLGQMVAQLKAKADDNPWINQIISRLEKKDGSEADFQSQFYTVFMKHAVLFDIGKKSKGKKGKYFVMTVNNQRAMRDNYAGVIASRSLGTNPLFNKNGGINASEWTDFLINYNRLYANKDVDFDKYREPLTNYVKKIARQLGIQYLKDEEIEKGVTKETFPDIISSLQAIHDNLVKEVENSNYDPFKYDKENNPNHIVQSMHDFIGSIAQYAEATMEPSFYQDGKMRQTYQVPSYTTKLFSRLTSSDESFEQTLAEYYGKSEWFFRDLSKPLTASNCRLPILVELIRAKGDKRKKLFQHKVNVSFDKDQYMRGMSMEKYLLSVFTEFASGRAEGKSMPTTFYRFPIQSNKNAHDFFSFYRYVGDKYKANITDGLIEIIGQELSRMQTVRMRNKKEGDIDYITNWDERGKDFAFLRFLNNPVLLVGDNFTSEEANELHTILEDKANGNKVDDFRLVELAKKAIEAEMNRLTEDMMKRINTVGLAPLMENIEGVIQRNTGVAFKDQIRDFVENFVWNDTYAAINFTELTVTDLAYYENDDDFQKRFAQIHSPGVRGNVEATDYKGRKVTDGFFRTVFIGDFNDYKSNILETVSSIFDRKIESATDDTEDAIRAMKENVLDRLSKINVTDGQSFASLTGFRKKGFVFGTWSRQAEELYERLKSGNYNLEDLETAFNVKKPFIYSQLHQSVGVEGSPIKSMPIATQIKDSEYLLIMAGALIQSDTSGKPNFLKALYNVMENSVRLVGDTKGIDSFAFDSTVKSGLTGSLDISKRWAKGEFKTEEELEAALAKQLYEYDNDGKEFIADKDGHLTYSSLVVKQIPVEDYAMQSEVPLHMRDHEQIHGSQMRAIVESNLSWATPMGEMNTYSWTDSDGNVHNDNPTELRRHYEQTFADFINDKLDKILDEFGLDGRKLGKDKEGNPIFKDKRVSKTDTRIAIAKALQKEIEGSSRYGTDLLLACMIDENGEFRVPPSDPVQSKRIEQLVNSIIKNRLNKPKVRGGLSVQVSNFGTSKQLNIRFYGRNGELLKTRSEFRSGIKPVERLEGESNEAYKKRQDAQLAEINEAYKKYCKDNGARYAYEEVYAPAHTKQLFSYFMDRNGDVDLEAVEMLDESLLFSHDQRTPTEFYQSVSISRIVGFMPKEAGDGGMRPYETTEIDDSDFDVDKRTKWFKEYKIVRNKGKLSVDALLKTLPKGTKILTDEDVKAVEKKVSDIEWSYKVSLQNSGMSETRYDRLLAEYEAKHNERLTNALKVEEKRKVGQFLADHRYRDKDLTAAEKELKRAYIKSKYKVVYPSEGSAALMNNAWEMQRAVMQNEATASYIFGLGGFAPVERRGYRNALLRTGRYTPAELDAMTTKELKKLAKGTDGNLMYFNTQIDYYQRNNDASQNLGAFAVASTAHNLLEGRRYYIHNDDIPYTIMGKTYGEYIKVDPTFDDEGLPVSKHIGSNVAASADAAKTPSHSYLNITPATRGVFVTLLRTGMPIDKAMDFMSTKVLSELITKHSAENLEGYAPILDVVGEMLEEIRNYMAEEEGAPLEKEGSRLDEMPLTEDEVLEAIMSSNVGYEIQYKILLAFERLYNLENNIKPFTFATRYNSSNSAVGPMIADNEIHDYTVNSYSKNETLTKLNLRDWTTGKLVEYGDKITDNTGKEVVITPDNMNYLHDQGVLAFEFVPITFKQIVADNKMLEAFSKGYDIADLMFDALDMVTNRVSFRNIISSDENIARLFSKNRKALLAFGDFYKTYLMMRSGVISQNEYKHLLKEFPKEFLEEQPKYRDNAFVNAIRATIDEDDTIALKIETVGIQDSDRAKLQSGWLKLHNDNPEFSTKLFKYCVVKGGAGFSPKTFLNLLPPQIKEQISGYKEALTISDAGIDAFTILDMFFRNNAGDNRLVPTVIIPKQKHLKVVDKDTITTTDMNFAKKPYFKAKMYGKDIIFRQSKLDTENNIATYVATTPLGNNGEFVEMGLYGVNPMTDTGHINSDASSDTGASERESGTEVMESKRALSDAEISNIVSKFANVFVTEQGDSFLERPEEFAKYYSAILKGEEKLDITREIERSRKSFERAGVKFNEDEIRKQLEEFC